MAVFPGMVEVEAGIIASGVMADPLTVVMDVRRIGVSLFVASHGLGFGGARHRPLDRCRAVFGNVSTANGLAAAMCAVLCPEGKRKNQEQR